MDLLNFPLQKIIPFDEQYISRNIFDNITKSCTFPPIAIEEINSELWCYSYDGYGKVTFKDGSVYTGGTKFGVLTNEIDKSRPCQILFSDGEKYIGEIKDNILSGEGQIIFPSGINMKEVYHMACDMVMEFIEIVMALYMKGILSTV